MAAAEKAQDVKSKQRVKMATTQRPADQRSLLGFFSKENASHNNKTMGTIHSTSQVRYKAAAAKVEARLASAEASVIKDDPGGSILPELAQHKPAVGKSFAPTKAVKMEDKESKKRYACFSSSPPRPPPAADVKPDVEEMDVIAFERPAAVLHTTTLTSMNGAGALRRPVGLGPRPSMDRLRKPFKPLTINRPRGPP
jgi:DNA helicase-2/ATP-dependent DNA helicase PcrA